MEVLIGLSTLPSLRMDVGQKEPTSSLMGGWGDISSDLLLLVVTGAYPLDKELTVKEDLLGRGNRSY